MRTVNGKAGTIHVPADKITLTVPIVEAMDDSLILANSADELGGLLDIAEAFQRAYGVQTAWNSPDKTVVFRLGALPPEEQRTNRVTFVYYDRGIPTEVVVPVTDRPHFLRTVIGNAAAIRDDILAIDRSFPFNALQPGQLPYSILRTSDCHVAGAQNPRSTEPTTSANADGGRH